MTRKVIIRNTTLPKSPRVFDVTVDENGQILRYDMQNIKGNIFIDNVEVKKQIEEALTEKTY